MWSAPAGRGTGACNDTLRANDDVKIVAMGDVFRDKAISARKHLVDAHGDRVDVPDEAIFDGLDAYQRVIDHPDVDIVILTTSPAFRPQHLAATVAAGKHAFVEKPVCVDAAGYRSCLESGRRATAQGTAIVSGTMYRRQPSYMEAMKRIHEGAIGDPVAGRGYYCSTGIWYRPRKDGESDASYQLNNWYHFVWLCGDQIVEQAVHNIDALNWAMGGPPVRAYGSGGQMTRPDDSEIWDNINIDFEYANGALISFKCRQIPGSTPKVINTFYGTDGTAFVNPGGSRIEARDGSVTFELRHEANNPYEQEHADLLASIRDGAPIVEIETVAQSSLTAVMGRMAAYSGQEVTWEQAEGSGLDLMVPELTMDMSLPTPQVAVPRQVADGLIEGGSAG